VIAALAGPATQFEIEVAVAAPMVKLAAAVIILATHYICQDFRTEDSPAVALAVAATVVAAAAAH
jgi:hypothetical protein